MNVILLEKINKLGELGSVVTVRNGYARNYLVPMGKALLASRKNRARFDAERAEHERRQEGARGAAKALAEQASELTVVISRAAGNSDKLFGSVTNSDIANFFKEKGVEIPRKVIELNAPIKTLGEHEIRLRLHSDVIPTILVHVERSAS